jgi:hypothetical protein
MVDVVVKLEDNRRKQLEPGRNDAGLGCWYTGSEGRRSGRNVGEAMVCCSVGGRRAWGARAGAAAAVNGGAGCVDGEWVSLAQRQGARGGRGGTRGTGRD